MIPTMMLLGLILGLVPLGWGRRATITAAVAVLGSVAFGLAVGELLGGTFLALANVAVGLLVGLAIQKVGRSALHVD